MPGKFYIVRWIAFSEISRQRAYYNPEPLLVKHYLGDNSVIETLLTDTLEPMSCCNDVASKTLLRMKLAGCVGVVRAIELLFIMRTTEAIFGLSATFSWTHSSPMWINLIISVIGLLLNVGSMRFEIVPSRQFFHACRNISMWTYHVREEKLHSYTYYFFFKKQGVNLPFYISTHID